MCPARLSLVDNSSDVCVRVCVCVCACVRACVRACVCVCVGGGSELQDEHVFSCDQLWLLNCFQCVDEVILN